MTTLIIYTTAPENYDYKMSTAVINPNVGVMTSYYKREEGRVVRKVESGFPGQEERYMSGLYFTRTEESWEQEVESGAVKLRPIPGTVADLNDASRDGYI